MKTIQIEIPEGKRAEWVDGVLTLVDDKAVEFKFKISDKVKIKRVNQVQTITGIALYNGTPVYKTDGNSTLTEEQIELYTEPKDITEQIKTFEDAYRWCESNGKHALTNAYKFINIAFENAVTPLSPDIIAFLKLRIIVAALNEGWEPMFERGEWRWYPWFNLYTKEEYDQLCDEDKSRAVLRSGNHSGAVSGFVFAGAGHATSSSDTGCGARLAFRTERLAEYAGTQFAALYADLCFKPE